MKFTKKSLIPAPAKVVFDWHREEMAFSKLIPPWEEIQIISQTGGIEEDGSEIVFKIRWLGPFWVTWRARHQNYKSGVEFQDVQIQGPFKSWVHTHRVTPKDSESCYLEDLIEYELPFSFLGAVCLGRMIRRKLEKNFTYRHEITKKSIGV